MSRTYRRKKLKAPLHATHDYKRIDRYLSNCGRYWKADWQWVPYTGTELKENIAKWHTSDNHSGIYSVPAWFNRMFFQRPRRRKQQAQLRKMLVSGNYDDYSFELHKKDAGWDWW